MLNNYDNVKYASNRNMIQSFQSKLTNPVVMCMSELMSHYTYLIYTSKIFINDILLCDVYTIVQPTPYLTFVFQI